MNKYIFVLANGKYKRIEMSNLCDEMGSAFFIGSSHESLYKNFTAFLLITDISLTGGKYNERVQVS